MLCGWPAYYVPSLCRGEMHDGLPLRGFRLSRHTQNAPLLVSGLLFGNGGTGGAPNQLFFTAGIPGPDMIENRGLFRDLTVAVPEPGSLSLLAIGIAGVMRLRRCRLKRGRS